MIKTKEIGLRSYRWWVDYLGEKKERRVNHNTKVSLSWEDNIIISLHGTDILVISPLDRYMYNTGGFSTLTTKRRMNELGPLTIAQHNWNWLCNKNHQWGEYRDGIIVDEYCYEKQSLI